MVQELGGKKVRLDFADDDSAYGTLAGANNGFFKLVGEDGSAVFYNIAHVTAIEEDDGSSIEEGDAEEDDHDHEPEPVIPSGPPY